MRAGKRYSIRLLPLLKGCTNKSFSDSAALRCRVALENDALLLAVREVLAGHRYITPVLEKAFAPGDNPSKSVSAGALSDPLTARQHEVLQLVAEGHSNGHALNGTADTICGFSRIVTA